MTASTERELQPPAVDARYPEPRPGNVILEIDAIDAVLLEGVLGVLERETRADATAKEAAGDMDSAEHIEARSRRWRRIRVALERAVYPAKDRRLSGIEQYQSESR